jgi:hypothetical protein
MKKNKRWLILFGILIVFAIWWINFGGQKNVLNRTDAETTNSINATVPIRNAVIQHKSPPKSVQLRINQTKQNIRDYKLLWRTPLLYYGKVIDENGKPISGVKVSYHGNSINETLTEDVRNSGSVTTDQQGIFKIDGIYGIGLMFDLNHPDYYAFPDNMSSYDIRDRPKSGVIPNSQETAMLFRMKRKGHPVQLVHRRGGADVPVNSGSATVKFLSKEDNTPIGTLLIEAWGDTPKNWSQQHYDWSVRLTIPNGGLIESTNYFDFVAPESGYQPSVDIIMSKDQPGWSDTVGKWFFLKLPAGYVRMRIHIRAKTPLYVSLEYYFNPDGSPNLEPAK